MGGSGCRPESPKNKTPGSNNNNQEIGITPDEIQNLREIKRNLETQVITLTNQNNLLQQQLNIFQQNNYNMQGQLQNVNATAFSNINQAQQQIKLLQNKNMMLIKENNDLKIKMNNLNGEIEKLKFYSNKLQIMLLDRMQKISMNDNINSLQQINGPFNNNNNANNNNMNNNSNFNFQNTANSRTIIFNVNNKMKCPVLALPNHKLGNIFMLILYQNGYSNFLNIRNFKFYYSTNNISNYFYNNQEVKDLPLNTLNYPVIEVTGF